MTGHDHVLSHPHGRNAAALDRFHAEFSERMHEAEAGGLVIGEREAAHHRALVGGDPDRARLGDEISDGEDEAVVADHHAASRAQRAQDLRGKRVFGNFRAEAYDRVERPLEVKTPLFGPRPHLDRKGPFAFLLCHPRMLLLARLPGLVFRLRLGFE